jgi:hypothetical protein
MTDLIRDVREALAKSSVDNTKETAYLYAHSQTWMEQLTDQLEEAIKALEVYANDLNWLTSTSGDLNIWHQTYDGTELAVSTLKRIKGDG